MGGAGDITKKTKNTKNTNSSNTSSKAYKIYYDNITNKQNYIIVYALYVISLYLYIAI